MTDSGGVLGSASITVTVSTAPVVTITAPADGASFTAGSSITFTGSAIDTEDGDISASLSWSSDLDGAIGTGGSFSIATLSGGTHTITASVTDSGGVLGSASITVTVNTAPVVTITAPADGASFTAGTLITFTGSAIDTEDGDISASLSWSSDLDGAIGTGVSFSIATLSVGTHTITASVTDSGGVLGSASITVTVSTAPVVAITAPVDGSSFTAGSLITFTGSAIDTEDGDIAASLSWSSDLDGAIGTGGSFSIATLSVGTHTITASVTDSGGVLGSASITVTVSTGHISTGLQVLYTFAEGSGSVVHDQSNNGLPMDLSVTGSVSWSTGENGVVMSGGRIGTVGAADKVIDALKATSQSTSEVWIEPANLTQDGPARILSIGSGSDTGEYNLVLGQLDDNIQVRLMHTGKDQRSRPRLTTSNNFLTTGLTHLVHTYDGTTERLYVNGVQHPTTVVRAGVYSNWDINDKFNIGNEATLDRPWYGTVHLVAVYDRALSEAEIQQNFAAGPVGDPLANYAPVAMDDSASTDLDTPVIVDVLDNDTDVEGDPLTVSSVSQGGNGTVVINPDNTVTYTPNTGFTGVDNFTYTASDGTDDSNVATVTMTIGVVITTFEVRVAASSDDAEERASGNVSLTSSDLELVNDKSSDQTVGIRFNGVNIPPGATIVNAYVQFQADETSSGVTSLTIEGEDTDDAQTFSLPTGTYRPERGRRLQ